MLLLSVQKLEGKLTSAYTHLRAGFSQLGFCRTLEFCEVPPGVLLLKIAEQGNDSEEYAEG